MSADVRGGQGEWEDRFLRRDRGDPGGESGASYVGGALYFRKGRSGTVFFTGCTLRCVFCQNHEIAGSKVGKVISEERLAEIFLELQGKGANNINLVTPTHFVPQIIRALQSAKKQGNVFAQIVI